MSEADRRPGRRLTGPAVVRRRARGPAWRRRRSGLVASCGIDASVKLWRPSGESTAEAAASAAAAAAANEARRRATGGVGRMSVSLLALIRRIQAAAQERAVAEEDGAQWGVTMQ